jgi:putative membrane protein
VVSDIRERPAAGGARQGPVLIELDEAQGAAGPAEAPPILDGAEAPTGAAMQAALRIGARRASPAARLFWSAAGALLLLVLSLAAWDYVTGLLQRLPVLGWIAAGLGAVAVVALLVLGLRELAALARLGRLDGIRQAAEAGLAAGDAAAVGRALDRLVALYSGRAELARGRARLAERRQGLADAEALTVLAEAELLAGLDAAASREVEAAARQVAAVTAFVPLALADVAAALFANLRMIRRIAEIYGGRGGVLGGWRLTRAVLGHLVATGAVAVGDDLIGSMAGGGLLAKLSRRFGEGVVNGALTARVGVAAIEVCRPLPFHGQPAPRVTALVRRALTGLFERGGGPAASG